MPDEWAGKIVIAEGYPEPSLVARLEAAGAIAQLYVNPGSRIHWSACSPIWGSPGESQMGMKPKTPVVSIDRRGGDLLLEAVADGLDEVVVHAELDEGWYDCPVPVARIDGLRKDFVLVHGHYDSWDIGIGSNAVGNATMLELARLFHERQGEMRRSLRIAWWPGTLTGSFAGSAWYADNFALEIARNCVAAVNVESPGCLGATDYDDVVWMAEAEDICRAAIASVTEAEPTGGRPPRAGDYSLQRARSHLAPKDALEDPERGAREARLLSGRRLWREHRVAHRGRPAEGRRPVESGARSSRLPDAGLPAPERRGAAAGFPSHCGRAGRGARRQRGDDLASARQEVQPGPPADHLQRPRQAA